MSQNPGVPVTLDVALPGGAVQFWGNVYCSTDASASCSFASAQVVSISTLALTVHDATTPAVAATGGSLAAAGSYGGTQQLLYRATSAGSGVAKVTLALGSTVVGTATPTCAAAQLVPCPPSTTGQFNVDTTQVPDGSYPVILTATDASGDSTPTQVATVTVDNHPVTTTTLGHTGITAPKGPRGPRKHHVDIHAKLFWSYAHRQTRFARIRFDHRLPAHTTITLTCTGKGCPVHRLRTKGGHVKRFLAGLYRRRFRAGDTVTLTFSRPHRVSERVRFTMRVRRTPRLKVLK